MLKRLRNLFVALLVVSLVGFGVTPSSATETLAISVTVGNDGSLTGSSVTNSNPSQTLYLTIYTEGATLSRVDGGSSGVTTATTFANGMHGIHVFGTASQLNSFLSELSVSTSGSCGANYKIYGQVSPRQIIRNPGNGHFYLLNQSGPNNFAGAVASAAATAFPLNNLGTKGYFATVTSDDEYQFLQSTFNFNLLLGASDAANSGTWVWASGPEKGKTIYRGMYPTGDPVGNSLAFWANEYPNSQNADQHYLAQVQNGWIQYPDTADNQLVEFGGFKGDKLSVSGSTNWSESIYTGTLAGALYQGNGSGHSPYIVKSVSDIQNTSQCGGQGIFFKQTKNIKLPANYSSDGISMMGIYDGANHSIQWSKNAKKPTAFTTDDSGVWMTIGWPDVIETPFQFTGLKSAVRNLNVSGNVKATDVFGAGLLAGDAYWTRFSNVSASGSIAISGDTGNIGGLLGYAEASDIDKVSSKVKFKGDNSTDGVGGIVGELAVSGQLHRSKWVGTAVLNSVSDGVNLGGLAGIAAGWVISHNSVKGTIKSVATDYIGGVVGDQFESGQIFGNKISIKVSAAGSDYIGGIAGRNFSPITENLVQSSGLSGRKYIGGILGMSDDLVRGNVYRSSKGSVTGTQYVGSLVGFIDNFDTGIEQNLAIGKVGLSTSRGAFGFGDGTPPHLINNFWSPANTKVAKPVNLWPGENPKLLKNLKKINTYSSLGASISNKWKTGSTWTICGAVNGKFPFPTAIYLSSPCPGKK